MGTLPDIKHQILELVHESYPDIELVYIFGSYAKKRARSNSDIDIAVQFKHSQNKSKIFRRFLEFISDVSLKLGTNQVDCVLLNITDDPLLLMQIYKYGQVVYDKGDQRVRFAIKAQGFYNDYKYLQNFYKMASSSK